MPPRCRERFGSVAITLLLVMTATALLSTRRVVFAADSEAPPPVDRYLLFESWSRGRSVTDPVRARARTGAADTVEVNSTRELTIREAADFEITLTDPTGVAFLLRFECWVGDGLLRVYSGEIPETAGASSCLQVSSGLLGIYGGRGHEGSTRVSELGSAARAPLTIQLLIVGSNARVWIDGTPRLAVDEVHFDRGETLMLRAEAGKLGPVRIGSLCVAEVDPRPWAARLRYAKSIETLSLAFEPGSTTPRSVSPGVFEELVAVCAADPALRLRFEPVSPDSAATPETEANAERVRIVVQGR